MSSLFSIRLLLSFLKFMAAFAGAAFVGLAMLAGIVGWLLSSVDPCGNDPQYEVASPDGRHRAVVFQRDCGATTGFSTHVSILTAGEAFPSEGGNVFAADSMRDPNGVLPLRITWTGDRSILIQRARAAKVFRSESRVLGVAVDYKVAAGPGL